MIAGMVFAGCGLLAFMFYVKCIATEPKSLDYPSEVPEGMMDLIAIFIGAVLVIIGLSCSTI